MKLPSRYWIRLALPAGMAVMYFAAKIHSEPASLKPYSVQMHLHGSMSEGAVCPGCGKFRTAAGAAV